jgi:alkanesulfonate monooxygenase SsuD/methylene tetrahydromethanopterin reductase-like flavin-dependent oxidoreductase (luciferase family)
MHIGIGLPNPIPDCSGPLLLQWATAAENRGFSSLATIDRIVFPSYESITSLAAAAAVTSQIGLLTNIVVLPTRDPVVIAKETATVAAISNGRLTVGVGVGLREDDFAATGRGFTDRGRRTDAMLDTMVRVWQGEPLAAGQEPVVPEFTRGTIPLLIGGYGEPRLRRLLRYGIGWTAGGITPDKVAEHATQVHRAWGEAGRYGKPRIVALAYFSLGAEAEERSYGFLRRYYAFGGNPDVVASRALRTAEALKNALYKYADAGVDELVLNPTVAELSQLERLADTVL